MEENLPSMSRLLGIWHLQWDRIAAWSWPLAFVERCFQKFQVMFRGRKEWEMPRFGKVKTSSALSIPRETECASLYSMMRCQFWSTSFFTEDVMQRSKSDVGVRLCSSTTSTQRMLCRRKGA